MEIIPYTREYRDDMIFMVLEAKNALGRIPRLNDDLLDVEKNYPGRFWLAVDGGRVVGCVGFTPIEGTDEAFLHRLFVKCSQKRRGVGSALLETAEKNMREAGIKLSRVHLGSPREQWFESYAFYPKHGYTEYAPRYMSKKL